MTGAEARCASCAARPQQGPRPAAHAAVCRIGQPVTAMRKSWMSVSMQRDGWDSGRRSGPHSSVWAECEQVLPPAYNILPLPMRIGVCGSQRVLAPNVQTTQPPQTNPTGPPIHPTWDGGRSDSPHLGWGEVSAASGLVGMGWGGFVGCELTGNFFQIDRI